MLTCLFNSMLHLKEKMVSREENFGIHLPGKQILICLSLYKMITYSAVVHLKSQISVV